MSRHDEEQAAEQPSGGVFTWFLAGVIIGAVCGVLYAPKSGKDTRGLIARKAQAGRDAVTGTTRDVYEAGKDVYDKSRQVVEDAAALFERGRKLAGGDRVVNG